MAGLRAEAREHRLPGKCPMCEGALVITAASCRDCGSTLGGTFARDPLASLGAGQVELLKLFVLHRGNMRRLAEHLGVSYPTIRARLDDLILALSDA